MRAELGDFAAFQANWDDKADQPAADRRASSNIGLDASSSSTTTRPSASMVRQALPEVAVPELPADPAGYAPLRWPAAISRPCIVTSEDSQAREQYRTERAAQALRRRRRLDDFLARCR